MKTVGEKASRRRRGQSSEATIKHAALECFFEHGYHGTSVRDIALRGDISVAGLYHHFPSKVEILFSIMKDVMAELTADTERAIETAQPDAISRLHAAVTAHVVFHTRCQKESFVSNTELRSLDPERRATILATRDSYEEMFRRILQEGVEKGEFRTLDPRDASLAIITMCTAVASWYREGGRLRGPEVAHRYGEFVLGIVRA